MVKLREKLVKATFSLHIEVQLIISIYYKEIFAKLKILASFWEKLQKFLNISGNIMFLKVSWILMVVNSSTSKWKSWNSHIKDLETSMQNTNIFLKNIWAWRGSGIKHTKQSANWTLSILYFVHREILSL